MKELIIFTLSFITFLSCAEEGKKEKFINQKLYLNNYSDSYIEYSKDCVKHIEKLFFRVKVWNMGDSLLSVLEYVPKYIDNKEDTYLYFITKKMTDTIVESYCYSNSDDRFTPIHFMENKTLQLDTNYHIVLPISGESLICGTSKFKEPLDKNTIGFWRKVDNDTHEVIQ